MATASKLFEIDFNRLAVILFTFDVVDPELWLLVVDVPASVLVLETYLLIHTLPIDLGAFEAHVVFKGFFVEYFAKFGPVLLFIEF